MKFTEGYWEKNEDAHAMHAMQVFTVEEIPNGMRIVLPVRAIKDRAGALDVSTITTEFTSAGKDIISVRSFHYSEYDKQEPRYSLNIRPQKVTVETDEKQAVMKAGRMTVRVDRENFCITFEADGNILTKCGFRNIGYMQYGRKNQTLFPRDNYMFADYKPFMETELSLAPGECVYGLGERFTSFIKNGQVVDIWNEDGGTASQIAYKNIPFYITNRNYGVYVDHSDEVSFEVASEKVEYVGFSVRGEEIRYNIMYGESMKDVLMRYTDLTGKPPLLPQWSFGLWLTTSFTTNYDEKTTSSFIDGMKERDIPLRVFHFDCFWMKPFHWCDFEWDEKTFPDVKNMIKRYKKKGLKICVWINPYIAQGTKFFSEGVRCGYLLMRADGKGVKQIDNWQPGMGIVDFTNPKATKWYTDKLKTLLDDGVDCFKTDFGERIPIDVKYHDGSDPRSMHNYYTGLYNKAVFDLLVKEKGRGEAVLFARSATVGTQQYPVHWGGDCSASYASMAESLRGGLSLTLSGFAFWSHDMGGFEMTATPDLYKRWLQFGLLSTHSRLHGSKSYRVPWLFDEEAVDVCRKFTRLKARLMPYIYSQAVDSHKTGVPSMRAMVLEFDKDPTARYLDQQYMLGNSILVAPIFNDKGNCEYYLPKGRWTHLLSGEVREGLCWYKDTYDYFSLPLYVRDNTVLAMGSCEDKQDYDYTENVEIRIYELGEGADSTCILYEEGGKETMKIRAVRKDKKVTISLSRISSGMHIQLVNTDKAEQLKGATCEKSETGLCLIPSAQRISFVV